MEYTEQEIEMLARFDYDSSAARRPCWDELEPGSRRRIVELVFDLFADDSACSVLHAAARLMREARHEGRLDAAKEHMAASNALHSERDAQEDRAAEDARKQARKDGALYHADAVVLARSPLAAACVRQGVTAQAAANAFECEIHELTQELIRHKTNTAVPMVVSLDAISADLIKKAREQGAAEMRERAALVTLQPDICPVDGPVAAERIRSLPLTVPQ